MKIKSPLNILIAEDDSAHSMALSRNLERKFPNAAITVVTTIHDYSEYIASSIPSVAIVDLNLSDGCTINLLNSPENVASFPVIMMTSFGTEQVAAEAIKRGALDYLVKSPEAFASIGTPIDGVLREWQLIQDKRRIELQLKESQTLIIQQEKMASIGQLAAGVAHEINNPIGYISSNLSALVRYADRLVQFFEFEDAALEGCTDLTAKAAITEKKRQLKIDMILKDLGELISESQEGADRVTKIVRDLKSFSRSEEDKAVLSDLNECINSTINIVRNEIKYVAELNLQLGDIPPVLCYPQQISQVLMNLLVNAAHSIDQKGVISLATKQTDDWIEISVTDSGCGIAREHLERIFEPFFTTKEAGKGTGLGLAISADLIKKHGGELVVNSEVGKGSTFTIRLPL
ncbi:MAG: ATP-binding protein [Desulfuromonadaceae bacterium]|nr:ATP-binding protein [Desulfuromonadaceae bacterium]